MLKVTKLQAHVAFNQLFELNFVGCEFNSNIYCKIISITHCQRKHFDTLLLFTLNVYIISLYKSII